VHLSILLDTYGALSIDKCIFRNLSTIAVLQYWQEVYITNSVVNGGFIFSLSFEEGRLQTTNTSFHNSDIKSPHLVSQQSTYQSTNVLVFNYLPFFGAALFNDSTMTDSLLIVENVETLTVVHSVIKNTSIYLDFCGQAFFNNTQIYSTQVFLASLFFFIVLL